jgi:hypothetical protein
VSALLISLDPAVVVTQAAATYPTIPTGETATNDADPFLLTLEPRVLSGRAVDMELHVAADGGYSAVLPLQMTRDGLRWGAVRPGSPQQHGGL